MFPASASNVIAVSETTLNRVGNHLVSESMWSGSGGGCSTVFARASYQAMTCGTSIAAPAVFAFALVTLAREPQIAQRLSHSGGDRFGRRIQRARLVASLAAIVTDPLTLEHSHAVSLWSSRIARRLSL